jgi:hypothetical protein
MKKKKDTSPKFSIEDFYLILAAEKAKSSQPKGKDVDGAGNSSDHQSVIIC